MLNLNLDKEFINKKIIVTGASRGLGAMLCKALAERGAKLAMLSRSKKEMNKLISNMKNSSNHVSINVNLLKNKQIVEAIKKAKKFLKNIDIVLHVAGGGFGLKDALIKENDLKLLFQANLGAAAEINRLIVRDKVKQKTLKLIHVGSTASIEAVDPWVIMWLNQH